METQQTAQMIAWLDEERRKDKSTIVKLEERAESQAALILDQSRRIQSLESDLSALRASILTTSTFDEAISRIRIDFSSEIERFDERRTAGEQDIKKLRDMDREAVNKALEEIRKDISTRIERELQPRQLEEERLSRVATELQSYANNLSKSLEEFERSLTFLEEQRRQDNRRISDANSQITEAAKRLEGQQAKLELLEELSRRNERTIEEVHRALDDFRQQRQAWVEQEALATQERERAMSDMLKQIDGFGQEMENYANQFSLWVDTHRTMQKYVEDFDRLADRVDRRLNEVTEVQRLSEDRFRQEWEEFLQEDQKRWRQFTLNNEESWRENDKLVKEIRAQIAQINEQWEGLAANIRVITASQQETLNSVAKQFQTLREQLDESLSGNKI